MYDDPVFDAVAAAEEHDCSADILSVLGETLQGDEDSPGGLTVVAHVKICRQCGMRYMQRIFSCIGSGGKQFCSRKCEAASREETYTAFGKTLSISQWSEETGIPVSTIYQRIKHQGMSVKRALSSKKFNARDITFRGQTNSISGWARVVGMNVETLRSRCRKWGPQKALAQIFDQEAA